MGTSKRHVKFGLKIPNRLGKNVGKSQGGFFDSHCSFGIFTRAMLCIAQSFDSDVSVCLSVCPLHADIVHSRAKQDREMYTTS